MASKKSTRKTSGENGIKKTKPAPAAAIDQPQKATAKTKAASGTKKPQPINKPVEGKAVPVKTATKKATPKQPAPAKKVKEKLSLKEPVAPIDILKVEFRIRYHTVFGQSLYILGNHTLLGGNDSSAAVQMQFLDKDNWNIQLQFPVGTDTISYSYILKNADGSTEYDWGEKSIHFSEFKTKDLLVIDSWNYAGFYDNAFYTEPFKEVLLPPVAFSSKKAFTRNYTHQLKVKASLLRPGHAICLLGSMQDWNLQQPLLLDKKASEDHWTIQLHVNNGSQVEYKYGVYDTVNKKFLGFEGGKNRFLPTGSASQQVSINDGFTVLPNDTWKGTGIAVPVFSLRTQQSFGVGEFTDLKLLVDWAKQVGIKLVQILPVNDTSATHTWKDSYPYAAISAFALHPIYLNIEKVAETKNKKLLAGIAEIKAKLNAEDSVDYCNVIKEKWEFIRKLYSAQKEATFKKKEFKEFFDSNAHWLVPYSAFCYLKEKYGTSDFNQWPEHKTYDEQKISALSNNSDHDELNIHLFVQYHLHLQLKEAKDYAHRNGIIVKGDIPIGIYRYGADAWQQPELYHLEVQAGAPPDDFSIKGQNWGFPTYNWEKMKENDFTWWRQRFEQMSYYFDAFRIDHILGFFRIWSIPLHAVEGIMGRFVPAIPVTKQEIEDWGLNSDMSRYCQPFINEEVLTEIFGDRREEVISNYLQADDGGKYSLKPAFNTQRKVEDAFAAQPDDEIRLGLFDLISNVILFEEENSAGTAFHFRFAMHDTLSYKHLDNHSKNKLYQLYVNYFFQRQDEFWKKEAMKKLPALKRATNMLICGEDLGLVPHCVPEVMTDLGILSLEIQRMPKDTQVQFFNPGRAPYLSVVTPSTHDMSTIRGWWEENRSNTQLFYNTQLNEAGEAPLECEPWINKKIVLQHIYSPAMWSIFQMQDLLGISEKLRRKDHSVERINVPSNPQHYWNYRLHIPLEDLLNESDFLMEVKDFIRSSGRN